MDVYSIIAVAIWGTPVLASVACAVTRRVRVARIAVWCGVAALVVGTLGTSIGLGMGWAALSAPGLGLADRQRMLSNLVAESLYNAVMTGASSVPPLLLGWWVLRKHRAISQSPPT